MTRLEELARKHGLTTKELDGNGLRVGAIIPTDKALAFGRELLEECARIAENPYSDAVRAVNGQTPVPVGRKISKAIRALAEEGKGKNG